MLVITRSTGESFKIGEVVEVKVLSTKGGQVRIGIDAPRSVKVLRTEIAGTPKRPDDELADAPA